MMQDTSAAVAAPLMRRLRRIHFVGIGGSGMCGIAEVLLNEGFCVTGSDLAASPVTARLESLGARVFIGHRAAQVSNAGVVVISSAVSADNPEVVQARALHIPVVRRAEMLGELMRYRFGIAVCGTHGKTSTTSLIASVYAEAGKDPTYVIGGLLNSSGSNAKLGAGRYLIAEADESDASFLHLQPMATVLTNIEPDHLGTYGGDFGRLQEAFLEFLHNLPFYGLAVVCLDDPAVRELIPRIGRRIVTYGTDPAADVRLSGFKPEGGGSRFSLIRKGFPPLEVFLPLPGLHMAKNAAAAAAVALEDEIDSACVLRAFKNFAGVGRRFARSGPLSLPDGGTVELVDDYGHHPTEVEVTLEAVRQTFPGRRVLMVFQPHRYSRTRDLYEDFVRVLCKPDELVLLEVYPAGEKPLSGADARHLCRSVRAAGAQEPHYARTVEEAVVAAAQLAHDGDVIMTQGAGNVTKVAESLRTLWKPAL